MKIVFMGTPEFAVGILDALREDGYEISAVVTQPDRAKGRSGRLTFPPVKGYALKYNIPVFQPDRIKKPEAVEKIRTFDADLFIVAAFGQILPKEILDMPRFGCLNVHASLLPAYRGASPIQHVILNGDEKTGVTIMQMNEGLDTGDILYQKEIFTDAKDTYETLNDKLMKLAQQAIKEALPLLESGRLIPRPQQDEYSSYAPLITKDMGRIDFCMSAEYIERQVRAMNPWPGAYTFRNGKQLKIWEADVENRSSDAPCGQILEVTKNSFLVAAGDGLVRILSLQSEGKKRMSAHDFLLGVKMEVGEIIG